jgi:hypothetical protein
MPVQTQIQVRRSTAATWTSTNPTLAAGEMGFETDTGKFKIGTGSSAWSALSYANSINAIPLSTVTTNGDIIYGTGSSAVTRLGIGSSGQVLTVASGIPSWAAPTAGATNWSLLNSGGTALTGASTITVSGISSKDKIMVIVSGASSVSANDSFQLRLNADATGQYNVYGFSISAAATYSPTQFGAINTPNVTQIFFGQMASNAASAVSGYAIFSGTNTSGQKMYNLSSGATNPGGGANSQFITTNGGFYAGTSTISSVSIISGLGNFDAGTIFVYTSEY